MGPSCAVHVAVDVVSIVMDARGVGQDSFSLEEAEIYSWYYLLNYRAILRPIASDSSDSAIFSSVLHLTIFSMSYQ